MNCVHCNSEKVRIKDRKTGRWYCNNCGKTFTQKVISEPSKKIGMDLKEFTRKYDKEYILNTKLAEVMKGLKKDMVYERADVVTLTGLGNSYPGMSGALEKYTDQQGRANSKTFYGHPDTIAELKRTAKLT